jgi:hypothetical protein
MSPTTPTTVPESSAGFAHAIERDDMKTLAEHVLSRPRALREPLTHDQHRVGPRTIAVIKRPAGQEAGLHGSKV